MVYFVPPRRKFLEVVSFLSGCVQSPDHCFSSWVVGVGVMKKDQEGAQA